MATTLATRMRRFASAMIIHDSSIHDMRMSTESMFSNGVFTVQGDLPPGCSLNLLISGSGNFVVIDVEEEPVLTAVLEPV